MTLMKPAEGRWVDKGELYPERVIPVRIMCEEKSFTKYGPDSMEMLIPDTSQIDRIIQFTLSHYRQKAVMYYVISREVNIVQAKTFVKVR